MDLFMNHFVKLVEKIKIWFEISILHKICQIYYTSFIVQYMINILIVLRWMLDYFLWCSLFLFSNDSPTLHELLITIGICFLVKCSGKFQQNYPIEKQTFLKDTASVACCFHCMLTTPLPFWTYRNSWSRLLEQARGVHVGLWNAAIKESVSSWQGTGQPTKGKVSLNQASKACCVNGRARLSLNWFCNLF